jgi:hypothetical protein
MVFFQSLRESAALAWKDENCEAIEGFPHKTEEPFCIGVGSVQMIRFLPKTEDQTEHKFRFDSILFFNVETELIRFFFFWKKKLGRRQKLQTCKVQPWTGQKQS